MDDLNVGLALRNLDERTMRIEQILPTLATREELRTVEGNLRDEIRAGVEDAKQHSTILFETVRREVRAISEEGKRHTTVLFEYLRGDIRLLAEHVSDLMNRPGR